jgi:hypothetical protein
MPIEIAEAILTKMVKSVCHELEFPYLGHEVVRKDENCYTVDTTKIGASRSICIFQHIIKEYWLVLRVFKNEVPKHKYFGHWVFYVNLEYNHPGGGHNGYEIGGMGRSGRLYICDSETGELIRTASQTELEEEERGF